MKKKLISLLMAVLLAVSMVIPVQAASTFRDVPRSHWAYTAIRNMADRGIVSGVEKGRFDPEGTVTTAQFISMLMRMFYGKELAADTAEYAFWYEKVLQLAAEKGLLSGLQIASVNRGINGAEKWNRTEANSPMLREETAVLLYHYLKQAVALPEEGTLRNVTAKRIPDLRNHASILEQFAIATVYELGCLSGIDEAGTFGGGMEMTRAQACVALARVEKLVQASDGTKVGADWVKKAEIGLIKEELAVKTLVNGAEITEGNVISRIDELRNVYPHGMSCTNENFFYTEPRTGTLTGNSGCYAFAMILFDYVFGYDTFSRAETRVLQEKNFTSIKPGDHIRIHDRPHSVVVLEARVDYVKVVEGNLNGKVCWDHIYTKEELLDYQKVTVSSAY